MPSQLPIGLRVRSLRTDRGWSQADLAERAGTTKATISKLEASTGSLSGKWLTALSGAFGIAVAELLDQEKATPTLGRVPLVGRIAAGNWREAIMDPSEWVPAMNPTPNSFALRPDGDSMDRAVPDGAYVVVNPDDKELRDGRIYAVMNGDGETTLKRYRSEPARLEPESTNPAHQPILLGSEPISVVGRVSEIFWAV